MARPIKPINAEQVERMASVGCTVEEIALVMECNKKTLERRFVAVLEKGRARLRSGLRHKQVQMALAGDKTMLVWLGKQLLGQRDRMDSDINQRTEIVTIERMKPRTTNDQQS
jgi:hypothetical protein|tara:strand:+ start:880 stop:1218 length:339 start_codon:yes stop_codon:yes gene_type:complete